MQATTLRPHVKVTRPSSSGYGSPRCVDLDRELHAGLRCSCRMPDLRARERRSTTSESSGPKSILQFGKLDLQKARRETQLWPINRLMFLISSAVLPCRYVAQHTTLFIPTQSCMSNRSSYLTSCCIPACRMLAVRLQTLFMHRVSETATVGGI